ncbi:hypothetical protein AKJ51_03600 [candidate division MSBL1 archaeon SCGC-AAA382A20]|uniref:Molybdopterin dinucleotide-binding domain-containing protein n=1 Tax=candidate division MSBL1 archaeon SCGC-AAA382A20 TaxID=1698280 RepID=A0A133VJB2_9EURY|nr:hypothetical protein AKJ51_03600 [candidate division MSBL1 archaeon SCGC-AAA382A20]
MQGIGIEKGKDSEEYNEATSTLFMDPDDMKAMEINAKDHVKLKTEESEIVLKVKKSFDAPHRGVVFIPYGSRVNKLIGANTDSMGMPDFKNIPATVEKTDEELTATRELEEKNEK